MSLISNGGRIHLAYLLQLSPSTSLQLLGRSANLRVKFIWPNSDIQFGIRWTVPLEKPSCFCSTVKGASYEQITHKYLLTVQLIINICAAPLLLLLMLYHNSPPPQKSRDSSSSLQKHMWVLQVHMLFKVDTLKIQYNSLTVKRIAFRRYFSSNTKWICAIQS